MKPGRNMLDFISAAKSFQVDVSGPDELTLWFSETMNMLLDHDPEFGIDVGNGVKRYTNNTNGGPVFVYVKDDKIIRITPIDFDEEDADPWVINARGRRFSPPKKGDCQSPWTGVEIDDLFKGSPSLPDEAGWTLIPMVSEIPRIAGSSGYERISWDTALDLVAGEIKRAKQVYGPGAILNGSGSHHTWGALGYWLSGRLRFFNSIGFTPCSP